MKLSTRLSLAMVSLVLLTAAIIGGVTYGKIAATVPPRVLAGIEVRTRLLAVELESAVRALRADALGFRSSVGVDGMVRASLAGGTDPRDGTSVAEWRDRLTQRLVAELAAKPDYAEFRIIGVADGGRELLRVDRSGPNGAIRVVPEDALQPKGERRYFQRAIELPPGGVDVSPIELAQESDRIVVPHMPVIRAAAPIHLPDGRPFGAVVINLDLRAVFDNIRSGARGEPVYLVNERGDYLIHPDRSREFGFEFGKPQRMQDDFPELDGIGARDLPRRLVRDRAGAEFGVAPVGLRLAQGPAVTLVLAWSHANVMEPAITVRNISLAAAAIAVGLAIALAVLLARSLTRPLERMTAAVEAFGRGEPMAAPVGAQGEIGVLARAFTRAAGEVEEKSAALMQETAERRRLFETSRESERAARGIIDTALDAFIQMDEAGKITEWNAHAEMMFGWPRAEAVGRSLAATIIPPAYRARYVEGIERFLRTGEGPILERRYETDACRRDGQVIKVEIAVTALRRRSGYLFNAFVRDLTEKISAEAQLRESQKMDAIGQLTGGVAHDFNNILTVITGTIDILRDGVADRPQLAQVAGMIDEAATRGAQLTQQLLAFARRQPLQPRVIDPNALVTETASLLRPTLGEHIEIEAILEDDAWRAVADPAQLTAALLNLAVNARDAMPGGGKLMLETANVILDEAYAELNAGVRPGSYVMIAVSDTGGGIPAALIEKVFEPFFTTKEVGRGTGLGLSMVYGFVKQSEGHIKIYSEEGYGTTIKIYLPRVDAAAEAPAEIAPALVPGGHETILVVEDDALVRQYVEAQLASLGYSTLAAANGAEALEHLEAGAAFDLLFTDVIMPGGMNGKQLAEEVERRRPGTRILFTSGYTENAIVHHGRLDAGVILLNKPYRKKDLAQKLRLLLDTPPASAA